VEKHNLPQGKVTLCPTLSSSTSLVDSWIPLQWCLITWDGGWACLVLTVILSSALQWKRSDESAWRCRKWFVVLLTSMQRRTVFQVPQKDYSAPLRFSPSLDLVRLAGLGARRLRVGGRGSHPSYHPSTSRLLTTRTPSPSLFPFPSPLLCRLTTSQHHSPDLPRP